MLKELQDIGLSEKEAKVYLASLDIGRATADQLAKQSKIVRSTTYVQIESLMKKGLMSTYQEGKKTYFAPESPEYLKRIFELKKQEFEVKEHELANFLPELLNKFEGAGERPMVRFFSGKEGITAMREETLKLKKDDEILIIYCYDALKNIYTEKELFSYTNRRIERGIKVRSVYTKKGVSLARDDITPNAARRFIPYDKMPIGSDFFVYKNNVAVMSLNSPIFGIIIESKEIAESFRVFFSLMWSIGVEDH
ncbi:MAG TPA: helix-turn-helix domain-containing protein [Candidatus Paceibacterota bacterium]|nr:helix-turn-helix domain-containing protein [Candidatus Paceibacterota bacterium]